MDVTSGTVMTPSTPDFMSYCNHPWISLYHHACLLNAPRLNPFTLAPREGEARYVRDKHRIEPSAVISILGFTGPDDDVDGVSVSRLVTRPEQADSTATDMVAKLLDADGRLLSARTVHALRLRSPGQGGCPPGQRCRVLLKAYLPDTARGARLRLRRGNQELRTREAPGEAVTVSEATGRIDGEGRLELHWETTESRTAVGDTWMRWSGDQGATWHGLTVGLEGRTATLDLRNVPGGQRSGRSVCEGRAAAETPMATSRDSPLRSAAGTPQTIRAVHTSALTGRTRASLSRWGLTLLVCGWPCGRRSRSPSSRTSARSAADIPTFTRGQG